MHFNRIKKNSFKSSSLGREIFSSHSEGSEVARSLSERFESSGKSCELFSDAKKYLLHFHCTSDPDTLFCFFTPGTDQMKYVVLNLGVGRLPSLIPLDVLMVTDCLFFLNGAGKRGSPTSKITFSECFNPVNRHIVNIIYLFFSNLSSPSFCRAS